MTLVYQATSKSRSTEQKLRQKDFVSNLDKSFHFSISWAILYIHIAPTSIRIEQKRPKPNRKITMAKEEEDDNDDHYTDIGFMFEGSEASTLKYYEFKKDDKVIAKVALHVVDQDPGAVQSGHYLWPGAPALAQHLIDSTAGDQPKNILELGAGCALASILSLQLFVASMQTLVTTDHDPGTLERAVRNHDATLEYLDDYDFSQRLFSLPIRWESLKWGDEKAAKDILSRTGRKFDLVLGSDLIYDITVVQPLFQTVAWLMDKDDDSSKFVLSQSFVYDKETELEMEKVCSFLGLGRAVLQDDLNTEGGVKLQNFEWKK